MKQYLELLQHILDHGKPTTDRTGVGTISVFGYQNRYDLDPGYPNEGFPILTTKKMWFKGIVTELLWYLKGDCNLKYLHDHNVHIWDAWQKDGEVVNCYPKQWRKWEASRVHEPTPQRPWRDVEEYTIDQVTRLVERIKKTPDSRRLILTAWNPADEDEASLPWCQSLVQFKVYKHSEDTSSLSCHLYQRSGDAFLGVPWNITFYALFTCMVAQVCGLVPGEFIHTFGDVHIYSNAVDAVKRQLTRDLLERPKLWLNPAITDIDAFGFDDIKLVGYKAHPNDFKVEVAV